jgi:exo-beta-1,3-glucanase (GH17 family)
MVFRTANSLFPSRHQAAPVFSGSRATISRNPDMKLSFCAWLAAFALASTLAHAEDRQVKGINYDPVHSIDFAVAVGTDDQAGMIRAIELDLDKIKALHAAGYPDIRVLKTFFSSYSSLGLNNPRVVVKIADVVAAWNRKHPDNAIQLALGVYEFREGKDACQGSDCESWTAVQAQDACLAANAHPGLIRKIVVGNENLEGDNPASHAIGRRMATDIMKIRTCLEDRSIKVGTAQTAQGGKELAQGTYPELKDAVEFIGVNVYPFWSGTAYSSAKAAMEEYWKSFPATAVETVETEEGWPSDGGRQGNAVASPDKLVDYFNYWYKRTESRVPAESYYFALFDKTPGQGVESHWGLFSADRHSGVLGNSASWKKPLAPENRMVKFVNRVGGAAVAISACSDDWNGNGQGKCFPIDGYAGTGNIPVANSKTMMVETNGKHYKSLLVTYFKGNSPQWRLCYINQASLHKLNERSTVYLAWANPEGTHPCNVQ